MRKSVLFLAAVILFFIWLGDFVKSGRLESYLDAHPNPNFNSNIEYYWGLGLDLMNRESSAMHRYKRIVDKYEQTKTHPLAWSRYIHLLAEQGDRHAVVSEGKKMLEKYPNHFKSDIIRKKISIIEHGY